MAVTAAHLTDNTRRVSSGKVDRAAFTRMGGVTLPRAVDAYASRAEAEPTGRFHSFVFIWVYLLVIILTHFYFLFNSEKACGSQIYYYSYPIVFFCLFVKALLSICGDGQTEVRYDYMLTMMLADGLVIVRPENKWKNFKKDGGNKWKHWDGQWLWMLRRELQGRMPRERLNNWMRAAVKRDNEGGLGLVRGMQSSMGAYIHNVEIPIESSWETKRICMKSQYWKISEKNVKAKEMLQGNCLFLGSS